MRRRPLFWLCLSVLFFCAAAYFWKLGNKWEAEKAKAKVLPANTSSPQPSPPEEREKTNAPKLTGQSPAATTQSASKAGVLNSANSRPSTPNSRFAYRLSNTKKSLGELTRDDKAILLENALVDTTLLRQEHSGGQAGSKDLG